ncbi:hypothetical protein BJV77DRAFT_962831 [Russula vinacea]|nr:hypothetical protein BJV77DRAFT_962831 [Russula vinacea]
MFTAKKVVQEVRETEQTMTISVWALESPSVGSIVYFATGFPALSNRPYHRSRREPAPVQRRSPSPRTTEMTPCTTRLLCSYTIHSTHSYLPTPHRTREGVQQLNLATTTHASVDATRTRAGGAETLHFSVNDRNDIRRDPSPPPVHTRSTDSHLPTPHRTHEGVQHPNLTVSTRGTIRLITLTFLSLRPAQDALSPLEDSARERGLPPERLSVPFKDHSPYYAILAVLRSKDPIPPDDANIWPACLFVAPTPSEIEAIPRNHMHARPIGGQPNLHVDHKGIDGGKRVQRQRLNAANRRSRLNGRTPATSVGHPR